MLNPMRQPQSIRFHLTAVFLLFFLLVVVLGFVFAVSLSASFWPAWSAVDRDSIDVG